MNEQPEVSAKEFGALQAKVEYIKDGVDKHTVMLERIENIARANVTQSQLKTYIAEHEKESEEKYVKRTEVEGVMNFWSLVTSNLAKVFALALVGLAIYATNNLIQQNKTVTELQEEVQQTVRRK
nr:MAG TPA: Commd1 containing protein [Caudoviricetes sp.]